MTTAKRYTITKLAPSRFLGVREAARGLRVRPQSIYMYVGGWQQALGPKKRERLEVIDLTASGTSGHAGRVTLPMAR